MTERNIIDAFSRGYYNPNSFDQAKLLKSNNDLAKAVIKGITAGQKDRIGNNFKFMLSMQELQSKYKESK